LNALSLLFRTPVLFLLLLVAGFSMSSYGQSITNFSPQSISSGTRSSLTITGLGFGTGPAGAQKYVEFPNADDGGMSYISPELSEYVSWSDNQIVVYVPSDAGTGPFRVVTDGNTVTSSTNLTVTFSIINSGVAKRHVNKNGSGGYTFQLENAFNALTPAKNAFVKSLAAWTCQTGINWTIGANTAVDQSGRDGTNVVRFDSGNELPAGVLGVAITYSQSCGNDNWEIVETDLVFDKERNWYYDNAQPGPSQSDFQSVALHELGHAHNLGHVIDPADMMNFSISGGTTRRVLSASNQNGGAFQVNLSKTSPGGACSSPMVQVFPASCTFSAPEITSVSPVKGGKGTVVTITGKNLNGASVVSFGGTAAQSFSIISDVKIEAVLGEGATGAVSVTTPGGVIDFAGFTFLQSPVATSFTPLFGFKGDKITISGSNLEGLTGITFGGTPAASFSLINNTKAEAVLADGSSGDIVVTTEGGSATLSGFVFAKQMSIASVVPTSGKVGDTIIINGTDFREIQSVKFGGVAAASFLIESPEKIVAVLGEVASGTISLSSAYGTASFQGFTFFKPPLITSFSPQNAARGATVRISGENFTGTTEVKFGDKAPASFVVNSSVLITAVIGDVLSGAVSLTTPGGKTAKDGFVFIPTLEITSVNPLVGTTGTAITITGSKFRNVVNVSFGGTPAKSFIVKSSEEIVAIVGNGTSGEVLVHTSDGKTTTPGFRFLLPPTITHFTPSSSGFGLPVVISGTNFSEVSSVTFGGVEAASFKIRSTTSIEASPASGASGAITVTTPAGMAEMKGFTFIPLPIIQRVDPTATGAGFLINIYGEHLLGTKEISIGGSPASGVKVITDNHVTVVVPANSADGKLVVLTTGGTVTFEGFRVIPRPSIASYTPQNAIAGTEVTISGAKFSDITQVSFGGKPALSFKIISDDNISAIVAPGSSSGLVSVTSAGGTASADGFTFNFTLPSSNFSVAAVDLACRGSMNGVIKISARASLKYIATLTGKGRTLAFPFTDVVEFKNMAAGEYTVCITIEGESTFRQCFELTVKEPRDLSLFSFVDQESRKLSLKMEGGQTYFVELNGELLSTSDPEMELSLNPGNNSLKVYTDKLCQGVIERTFVIGDGVRIFPQPFESELNLVLGEAFTGTVRIQLTDIGGKVVYSGDHLPEAGTIRLYLPGLIPGAYLVQVSSKDQRSIHKILKR
jgi:hypothetical protein